jgi:predicted  nucleic acid-binding Zn-ribbon protein
LTRADCGIIVKVNLYREGEKMKKTIFVVLMITLGLSLFGLDIDVVKKALTQEQAAVTKTQQQLVVNQNTMVAISNEAKYKQYRNRLSLIKKDILTAQYNFTHIANSDFLRQKYQDELKGLSAQQEQVCHEFEQFVATLSK